MQPEEQKSEKWDIPTEELYVPHREQKALKGKLIWEARNEHPEEKEFIKLLHDACYQMGGQKAPQLLLFQDDSPRGFSYPDKNYYSICLSTGLLENLSRDEVKAVIVHELHHNCHPELRRGPGTILPGAALVSLVGGIVLTGIFNNPIPIEVVAVEILGISAISKLLLRRDEFLADAAAKSVVGAELIANALTAIENRLKEMAGKKKSFLPKAISRIMDKALYPFLATHPSDEKRQDALGVIEAQPANLPSQEEIVKRMEKALESFRQHKGSSGLFTPNVKRTNNNGRSEGI